MTPSRRRFCELAGRALAGLAVFQSRSFGNSGPAIDNLSEPSDEWKAVNFRTYRADVVVAVMGVPIFSRRGVGWACASVRERRPTNQNRIALTFAGGSDPRRTHGLNYCGSTEEIAIETGAELSAAASFGFVTASSSDESLEHARRRVMGENGGRGSFTVVDEVHNASGIRIRKASVAGEQGSSADVDRLRSDVRSQFAGAKISEREIQPDAAVAPTFLYTMLRAIRCGRPGPFAYAHNGKRYELSCETSPVDSKTGEALLTGKIHDLEAKRHTTFRLWLTPGSDLPARIEFSPRSYLRITLEHDPAVASQEAL